MFWMDTIGILPFIMGLNRGFGVRKTLCILVLGNIAAVLALSGQSLDCTNDFEDFMFCHFGGENCTEYNMTLSNGDSRWDTDCMFKQCDSGTCCCSVGMFLMALDSYTAKVWKEGKIMESKTISVGGSIKPKTPTIVSVDESNGNFEVVWLTNTQEMITRSLTAEVTYREKGDTSKVSQMLNQSIGNGKNYYLLQDLKPSTTYLVSMRTHTHYSKKYSDSSEEWEFTTSMSSNALFLAIVISLSVAAVFLTGAIYGCYVKFRTKWWDPVAKCPYPKPLDVHASEHKVLKSGPPIISPISIEPLLDDGKQWYDDSLKDSSSGSLQQSSGISTGSSCPSYTNAEPANIIAEVQVAVSKAIASMMPTSHNMDEMDIDISSGSVGLLNKTYSILLPNQPAQIMTNISEDQTLHKMLCDSAYHPSEGVTVITTYQQTPACPLTSLPAEVSSSMPTDMSYQPCNQDSGRFSLAEDSSVSSISSRTNTTVPCDLVLKVEAARESLESGNTEKVAVYDDTPCFSTMPAGSHRFPAVDFDYQPFQSGAVEQLGMSPSEKKSEEKEEHLGKYLEDLLIEVPQTLFNQVVPCPINNGQRLSELPRPFLALISANKSVPVITDSGYQCV
ncbi:uncharacterized protein LOC117810956 [Notolabrus celidotus]|uniref:uncharacterized protein LOC117810956 n=1 Tax=Notolabrus celidotus TaxID=1203425 RepID=UPI00148FAFC2|nr:uncharacterized protein LOC117810956 [Notolabrus celidotus]